MTGVENVGIFIWEKVWLKNRHWRITQKKACNKQYPACLTILTMIDKCIVNLMFIGLCIILIVE